MSSISGLTVCHCSGVCCTTHSGPPPHEAIACAAPRPEPFQCNRGVPVVLKRGPRSTPDLTLEIKFDALPGKSRPKKALTRPWDRPGQTRSSVWSDLQLGPILRLFRRDSSFSANVSCGGVVTCRDTLHLWFEIGFKACEALKTASNGPPPTLLRPSPPPRRGGG